MRLSICIPTYNRAKYIGQTLRSALDQATDEVEIVVADNASADDTADIVARLFEGRKNVRYFRWPTNMGADRNFLKVIELSTAEYCWFMGSDDIVEPGGVARVLAALSNAGDAAGASVNFHAYTTDLSTRIWVPAMAGGALPDDRLFTDVGETVNRLGAYFGYLPGQVVKRSLWNEILAANNVTPYFNAYVHVYVILRMLRRWPRWLYVSEPCVGWRSGNDSFLSEGRYKRLAIDVVGYDKVAGDVFGRDSEVYRRLMNTVATVHVRSALFGAKSQGEKTAFYLRALRLCVGTYWRLPRFWLQTFPIFLLPRFAYVSIRVLYRATLKSSRSRRANRRP